MLAEALPTKLEDANLKAATRMDKITSMYAFEGFVYALDVHENTGRISPSFSTLVRDFQAMVAKGARNVITFDICGDGSDASYYEQVIDAAGNVGINIIPLVWTLLNPGDNFTTVDIPRINALTQAVINKPDPVLAVALGTHGSSPLYDNDFGSANNLAKYVRQMKSTFAAAGLSDIPVSISELAYGWQISDNITAAVDAVDFFMINNFPYFAFNAQSGGSATSWNDFTNDTTYYKSIAQGKPLLVTQTGWPSNEDQYAPNSPDVVASVPSEKAYWNLLDSHCEDFFKVNNIGWMWRSWDDTIAGWGVTSSHEKAKWNFKARKAC
ncbi:glycoside hydrolase [Phellopilus nigrolimitatus]|nr:glycoside hydrolase [Phellopilus nigrolimitatus]